MARRWKRNKSNVSSKNHDQELGLNYIHVVVLFFYFFSKMSHILPLLDYVLPKKFATKPGVLEGSWWNQVLILWNDQEPTFFTEWKKKVLKIFSLFVFHFPLLWPSQYLSMDYSKDVLKIQHILLHKLFDTSPLFLHHFYSSSTFSFEFWNSKYTDSTVEQLSLTFPPPRLLHRRNILISEAIYTNSNSIAPSKSNSLMVFYKFKWHCIYERYFSLWKLTFEIGTNM